MEKITIKELTDELDFWSLAIATPVIWTVHFLIVYILVEAACRANFLQSNILGAPAIAAVVIIATVLALAAAIVVFILSLRRWRWMRKISLDNELGTPPIRPYLWAETPQEFLALAGMILSPLFALLILITGIPALVLQPCFW